jgi:hypothetical protein
MSVVVVIVLGELTSSGVMVVTLTGGYPVCMCGTVFVIG